MTPADLPQLTIERAAELVRRREVSPVELAQACLGRIEEWNPRLSACITVLADEALARAREAEQAVLRGESTGPLHGVPLALKDTFAMRGVRVTCGSRVLEDHVPGHDAAVVERLRAAGAVFVAPLNMHEFAFGPTSANLRFGDVRNPWDRERIPGGSSGGSGAAVAASLCLGSLGTDAGGSIRVPAGLCGIVGLKPTYGRVSRFGTIPLSLTLDHVGPMTRTVGDAALLLEAIAGHDPRDPASGTRPVADFRRPLGEGAKGLRIGLPAQYFADSMETEVRAAVDAAVAVLAAEGAEVEEVSLPHARFAPAAFLGIVMPEAASLHTRRLRERARDYGAEVRRLLYAGHVVSGVRFAQAQRARTLIIEDLASALRRVDVLALPTTAIAAPRLGQQTVALGERTVNVVAALDRFCLSFNLAGLPAVSVPCGFTAGGLPIGLQLAGRPWAEATVLRAAAAYEAATPWHTLRPRLEPRGGAPAQA